jgi:GDP-L-fucose synthase
VQGADYVLNLVGIKGSVGIGQNKVASYLVPMLLFQTHLMEAAFRSQVSRFLFVGSICSYPQADRPKEEDTVWDGMPKQNDRIPGLAKRIGEIQGEAYLLEHKWEAVRIVRPANVFGPYDDFNPATAQVIPALIRRMFNGDNPVKVWGDGKAVRDFIYSEDVADGILLALEKAPPCTPLNLGSGRGVSIGELAAAIARCFDPPPALEFDAARPGGDPVRVLATRRAAALLGFQPRHTLPEALAETVAWLKQNIAFVREREAIQSNA